MFAKKLEWFDKIEDWRFEELELENQKEEDISSILKTFEREDVVYEGIG